MKISLLLLVLLAACTIEGQHNFTIGTERASIVLPPNPKIETAPATDFGEPERVRVYSHDFKSPDEFAALQKAGTYFDFTIYPSISWKDDSKQLIRKVCDNVDATIAEQMKLPGDYQLFRFSNDCFPVRMFALIHNNKLYEIRAGQDAMNYEALWQTLKTLKMEP